MEWLTGTIFLFSLMILRVNEAQLGSSILCWHLGCGHLEAHLG